MFGESPLSGNPLAVVEDADALSELDMCKISREFNQSETTFLLTSTRADWKLRSFTANGTEVFGAGHNALGTWLWLASRGRLGSIGAARTFHQEIGGAVLPITLESRGPRIHGHMKQSALKLLREVSNIQSLAAALSIGVEDICSSPPPRVASTGASHLLVRIQGKSAVDRIRPLANELLAVLRGAGAQGCYVYHYDTENPGIAYTRFFNPTIGLWEDAATGTAAGPLCGYLGGAGLLGSGQTLSVEQGVLMGRRSVLEVRLNPDPEIFGSGTIVLEGELSLE